MTWALCVPLVSAFVFGLSAFWAGVFYIAVYDGAAAAGPADHRRARIALCVAGLAGLFILHGYVSAYVREFFLGGV